MNVRLLLLFLFFNLLTITKIYPQKLSEDLLHRYVNKEILAVEGNIKKLTRVVYEEVPELDFNLSLLNYKQKSNYVKSTVSFDVDGNVYIQDLEYSYLNKKNGTPSVSRYNRLFHFQKNILKSIQFHEDYELIGSINFSFTYNQKNRISMIERIDSHDTIQNKYTAVEEIEYFDWGKKSTTFVFTDSSKTKHKECIYDHNNKLIDYTFDSYSRRGRSAKTEYLYNEQNKLNYSIFLDGIPIKLSESQIKSGYIPKLSGAKHIYYYNKNGFLKKEKQYTLTGEWLDGKSSYWVDGLIGTVRIKEKIRGKYIIQKHKYKAVDNVSNKFKIVVLDKHRNKILEHKLPNKYDNGTLTIWDITYHDE